MLEKASQAVQKTGQVGSPANGAKLNPNAWGRADNPFTFIPCSSDFTMNVLDRAC